MHSTPKKASQSISEPSAPERKAKIFIFSSFPNSIWERACLRNSIALTLPSNPVNPVQRFLQQYVVLLIQPHDGRLVLRGQFGGDLREAHDRQPVARLAQVRRRAVQLDHLRSGP